MQCIHIKFSVGPLSISIIYSAGHHQDMKTSCIKAPPFSIIERCIKPFNQASGGAVLDSKSIVVIIVIKGIYSKKRFRSILVAGREGRQRELIKHLDFFLCTHETNEPSMISIN